MLNGANGMSDMHGSEPDWRVAASVAEHGARGERRVDGQAARQLARARAARVLKAKLELSE